jgi:hypothetical protein
VKDQYEEQAQKLNLDICLLITKALVGKKPQFLMGGLLDILIGSRDKTVQMRILYLIDKKNINYESS